MHVQRVLSSIDRALLLAKFYFSLLSHYTFFFSVIGAAVISCCATRLQHLLFFFIISYNLEIVVVFSLFTEKS